MRHAILQSDSSTDPSNINILFPFLFLTHFYLFFVLFVFCSLMNHLLSVTCAFYVRDLRFHHLLCETSLLPPLPFAHQSQNLKNE